ncbi:uncharacterized protein LOC130821599 [Amaranthus tricolor]|uniref:uncharacterized protein LOC130821599 n=1 Tax=Amaranthus tricolor TaxID=29722 RepID=UPI00258EC5C2|nr:uncharacterized protein LOC130821599 [Amaranthus tricolor]
MSNRRSGATGQVGGLGAAEALDPLGAPGTTGASRTTPGAPGRDPTGYGGTEGGGQAQLHRHKTDVETDQNYGQVTSGFGSKAAHHDPLKTEAGFGGSGQSRDPLGGYTATEANNNRRGNQGESGWTSVQEFGSLNTDESAAYNTSIRGSKIETGTGGSTVDTIYAVQVTKIPVSSEDIGHVQAQTQGQGQGQLRRNDEEATDR